MLLRATSAESWLNSAAMLPQSQRTSAMGDSTQRALRPAAPRRAASGRCPRSRPSLTARALLLVCTTGSTSSLAPPAIHPRSSEQRFTPRSVRAGQHRTAPKRAARVVDIICHCIAPPPAYPSPLVPCPHPSCSARKAVPRRSGHPLALGPPQPAAGSAHRSAQRRSAPSGPHSPHPAPVSPTHRRTFCRPGQGSTQHWAAQRRVGAGAAQSRAGRAVAVPVPCWCRSSSLAAAALIPAQRCPGAKPAAQHRSAPPIPHSAVLKWFHCSKCCVASAMRAVSCVP